jgi:hypothetical protein
VKTVPFRSMNIIARSLGPPGKEVVVGSNVNVQFLGACGCDQGTSESPRRLVEFTTRRSRNFEEWRLNESCGHIGGSEACGHHFVLRLKRYDAVCGQLCCRLMNR